MGDHDAVCADCGREVGINDGQCVPANIRGPYGTAACAQRTIARLRAQLAEAQRERAALRIDRGYFKGAYTRKLADEARALDAANAAEDALAEGVAAIEEWIAGGARCVHCGKTVPLSMLDHWRECPKHPAPKAIAAAEAALDSLRGALREIEGDAGSWVNSPSHERIAAKARAALASLPAPTSDQPRAAPSEALK